MTRALAFFFTIAAMQLFIACSSSDQKTETNHQATPKTALADVPEWSKSVVWYQIFPERFRNGDPSNDPTPEDIDGCYPGFVPESWAVTPWTQDWYKEDGYFKDLEKGTDFTGNPITHFGQKSQMRRYGGDLQGVFDKLDYIADLGVTAIYFNPLNDAPSLHKYDARHWRHIDRNFGPSPARDVELMNSETPEDPSTWHLTGADSMFVALIDAFHQRGIRVILDYSWNHTGHKCWAWEDILAKQEKSKYKNWYWINKFDDPATAENEFEYHGWFGVFDLPEIRETEFVDHTNGIQPAEGNIYDPAAKQHIFNITKRWLDPNGDGDPSDGVDGFRLDVAAELPFGFWRDYRKFVRDINPDAYLLGEVWWEEWPDKLLDPKPFLEGDVFDAVMNYRWYRAARHFFNQSPDEIPVSQFVDSLERFRSNIRPQNSYAMMNLTASHDSPRVLTSLFNKNAYKFKAKPEQDETYKINKPDAETYETLKLLLAQQFTYIGSPHIWAGDEMGMWGCDDPSNRKPLIWKDYTFEPETTHPLGFDRPTDEVKFNEELFDYYKNMVKIRNENPVLALGDIEYLTIDDDRNILAYSRFNASEEVIVVFNTGWDSQRVALPLKFSKNYKDVLNHLKITQSGNLVMVTLPARTAAILVAG